MSQKLDQPSPVLDRKRRLAIAARVKEARGERRILDVAAACGLATQTVYRVEQGESCAVDTIYALAVVLGVDVGWLLRGDVHCARCQERVGSAVEMEHQ